MKVYTVVNHTAAGAVIKFKKNSNILLIWDRVCSQSL